MAEDKKILLTINLDATQFVDAIAKAKTEVGKLKDEQKRLQAEAKEALEKGLVEEYDKLNRAIIENENALKIAGTELRRVQKDFENVTLATKAQEGSYEQLYQQWKVADAQLKNLAGTLKKNADGTIVLTDEYKRAKVEVENAKKALNEFGLGVADGRLNVGNYAASLEQAINKSGLFGEVLSTLKEGFAGAKQGAELFGDGVKLVQQGFVDLKNNTGTFIADVGNNFTTATQSVKAYVTSLGTANKEGEKVEQVSRGASLGSQAFGLLTKATNIFKVALVSTGLGAFVVLAGSLVAFFTKTKEGSDKLAQGLGFLKGLFSGFIDTLASFGKNIFEALSKPKQLLTDLTDYIKSIVIPYFTGLKDILVGVFTLDLDQIKKGLSGVQDAGANAVKPFVNLGTTLKDAGANAVRVAQQTAEITAETQKLADKEAKVKAELEGSKQTLEALIMKSKDQTKSVAEREKAIKDAGELEKKFTTELLALAQEKLELKKRENALTDAGREALQEEAELQKEVNRLKGENAQLDQKVVQETNALRKEVADKAKASRAVDIQNDIDALNVKLENQRRAGEDTIQTQQEIAKRSRDLALNNAQAGTNQAKGIEIKYQAELDKILVEAEDRRRELRQQAQDLQLAQIADGQTREIAQEAVALQRRLAEIKGNSAEEVALRQALATESAEKVREIQDKYAQENLAKQLSTLQTGLQDELKVIGDGEQAKLRALDQSGKERLNQLKIRQAQGAISERELIEATNEIENEKLRAQTEAQNKRLDSVRKFTTARLQAEEQAYQNEKKRIDENLAQGLLTAEQYNGKLAELDKARAEQKTATEKETNQQLLDADKAYGDAKVAQTEATEQQVQDARLRSIEKERETRQALLGEVNAGLSAIQSALDADTQNRLRKADDRYKKEIALLDKARKKNLITEEDYNKRKTALEAQATAESERIQAETSKKRKAVAKGLLTIQVFSEISNLLLGASKNSAETGIIGSAAFYALAAIQIASSLAKYKIGIDQINAQQFASGGLVGSQGALSGSGDTDTLGNILSAYNPTINPGMRGGYVRRPTLWALGGERGTEYVAPSWQLAQAPGLFGMLNQWRTTRVKPFADGGFTSSQISVPLLNQEATEQALVRAFASAPAPVVTVEDINLGQNRVSLVESRASL